jgi:recombinational DNA repair protein (RecF pathway)
MICSHCEKYVTPKYQQEAVYSLEYLNKSQEKEFLCEEHLQEALEFGLINADDVLTTKLTKEKK